MSSALAVKPGKIANIDQLVRAVQASNSYGVLWNGTEAWDKMYTSQLMTFPARNQIAAGKGVLDQPVYDADGDPIPGSLMISDIKGAEGTDDETRVVFDARKCIVRFIGLPERLNGVSYPQKVGVLYEAGLRLLPPGNPTKAQVAALRVEGEAAWEEYQDKLAIQELRAWDEHHRRFGADSQAHDHRHLWAKRRLAAREARLDVETKIKAGMEADADLSESDLELHLAMTNAVVEMMTKMGIEDAASKTATIQKYLEDPKVRRALQKTHRIRKVGQAFEKDEDLEAKIQADVIAEAKAANAELKPVVESPGVE